MLSKKAFSFITEQFGLGDIDLLATRANKKVNKYILWKRDTDSISIDAFSEIWEKYFTVSLLFASFGKYQNQKEINQRKS